MTDTMPIVKLSPYLQSLYEQVASVRLEVETTTADLTEAQWNWSPGKGVWSIAQCLHHLNKVNGDLMPRLEAAIEQLRAQGTRGEGPFRYGLVERWSIRLLSPNPPFKMPVPPQWEPETPTNPRETVLPLFLQLADRLSRCLEAADGYDLRQVKVISPASSMVKLSVGAYLEAAVGHDRYHWLQAQAVRTQADFPASPAGSIEPSH